MKVSFARAENRSADPTLNSGFRIILWCIDMNSKRMITASQLWHWDHCVVHRYDSEKDDHRVSTLAFGSLCGASILIPKRMITASQVSTLPYNPRFGLPTSFTCPFNSENQPSTVSVSDSFFKSYIWPAPSFFRSASYVPLLTGCKAPSVVHHTQLSGFPVQHYDYIVTAGLLIFID